MTLCLSLLWLKSKMIYIIISFIVSLFLEIMVPNIFMFYIPLFCIGCITLYSGKYRYLIIFGLVYDFVFTKTLILHTMIFIVISFIARKLLRNSIINNLLVYILMTGIYIIFMFLYKSIYTAFDINTFLVYIKSSILLNIIYFVILDIIYITFSNINKKTHIFINR